MLIFVPLTLLYCHDYVGLWAQVSSEVPVNSTQKLSGLYVNLSVLKFLSPKWHSTGYQMKSCEEIRETWTWRRDWVSMRIALTFDLAACLCIILLLLLWWKTRAILTWSNNITISGTRNTRSCGNATYFVLRHIANLHVSKIFTVHSLSFWNPLDIFTFHSGD